MRKCTEDVSSLYAKKEQDESQLNDMSEALEGKVNRVDIDEPIGAILEMFKVEMNAVRSQQKKNIRTLRGELEVSCCHENFSPSPRLTVPHDRSCCARNSRRRT